MTSSTIPRATYRLQLHKDFTFADALAVVPYLSRLGVSHLYVSPILKARAGSTHGYDIVDHNAINPEIGTRADLEALSAELKRHGMGLVVDFVPNHMGVGGADNAWWLDVLEWGEDSPYARYFDIDWRPLRRDMRGKVLLPFLGDHYGAVLERGELVPRLDRENGTISVWYYDHRYPVAIRDYAELLTAAIPAGLTQGHPLAGIAKMFGAVERGRAERTIARRRGAARGAKEALAAMLRDDPSLGDAIDGALADLARQPPRLHALLQAQHYRVSYWRVAADEINYRRFFDINGLAALRMVEEPALFESAHALTLELIRDGLIQGLRIDHVDGLFNPAEYCRMLQAHAGAALGRPVRSGADQPLPLWVEKILARHEPIRRDWPVAGTTGYEFANLAVGLFVDGAGEAPISATYARFIGDAMDFEAEVTEAKRRIMDDHMGSELRVLAGRLARIAGSHWQSRDFTDTVLTRALKEVVAALPVYRTYVTSRRVTDNDRRYIEWAVAKARRTGVVDATVFDFLASVLDTSVTSRDGYSRRPVIDFVMRLQQYSGPVMAKGFEDTALYRYNRLIALNEVGGEPTRFGVSPAAVHRANRARLRERPHCLLSTATHDTKRGEDTRVRIAALSEVPDEWRQRLDRWSQLNQPFRKNLEGGPAPEPNDEIWIYQTMVGAWPGSDQAGFAGRLAEVVVKAVREAKRRTSWASPDQEYETAVVDFVRRILETDRRNPFLEDFQTFQQRVAGIGMLNGLAQAVLKLTSPGVPDIYQGTEFWDLSLVDPDNRRPVDYGSRLQALGRFDGAALPVDVADWKDGGVKQAVIQRILGFRSDYPDLFRQGAYRALPVRGQRAGSVLAFERSWGDRRMIVVIPLLTARLWPAGGTRPPMGKAWRGVHVDVGHDDNTLYHDLFSDRLIETVRRRGRHVLAATDLFAEFPMALLENKKE